MRTEFWEIGGAIWTDGRRPEVRIDYTPNFEEWGTHLPMSLSQTHRIHIVIGKLKPAMDIFIKQNAKPGFYEISFKFDLICDKVLAINSW